MINARQKKTIINKLSPYKPSLIGIFGSFARGENTKSSDLDILVDFKSRINLLDLIGLENELSESLKVKVDLITKKAVSPLLLPYIIRDLVKIF